MLWRRRNWSLNWKKWVNNNTVVRFDNKVFNQSRSVAGATGVIAVTGLLSSSLTGLVEWEVLAGAVGEQIGGGGVRDGAADSHGEFTAAAVFLSKN